MTPTDAIEIYNRQCNECKLFENAEARSKVCSGCLIESARNASILEQQGVI